MRFPIERDFRGEPLPASHHVLVVARVVGEELLVDVDAPYFGDPAPAVPAGVCDRLWEHEVVELYLADARDHYLEIELGPHGHHLVIELRGVRKKHRVGLPITYEPTLQITPGDHEHAPGAPRGRFTGTARVPMAYLTMPVVRANAYAIRGLGTSRVYSAHAPMGGTAPDFHALGSFVACDLKR